MTRKKKIEIARKTEKKQEVSEGKKNVDLAEYSVLSKEATEQQIQIANAQQILANAKQTASNTRLIDENIKLVEFKRRTADVIISVALLIYLAILSGGCYIIFYSNEGNEVTIVSISAVVLSFVAIFGIIIRSTLVSPQQSNRGDPNVSANEALGTIKIISGNQ